MNKNLLKSVSFIWLLLSVSSCANYQSVLQKPRISDGTTYGRTELPESISPTWYFDEAKTNIDIPPTHLWAGDK
ncbi:MAG: hypothetical protein HKN32_02065, partial [Flavobacteriales bacterium]|nr:hypothetical protein [Flavobacteriales bacterium]